jgi:hypothetical protein
MASTLSQLAKWDGTLIEEMSASAHREPVDRKGSPAPPPCLGQEKDKDPLCPTNAREFARSIHNISIATLPQVFEARLPTLAAIAGANSEAPFQLSGAKKGRI